MSTEKPKIKGGYILLSRKIIESEIWQKPPLYLKIWIYLLCKAQHKQYKNLDRGCLYIKINDIIEECKWKVGFRTVKPTKDQIFQALDWMRNASENAVTKATMKATMNATTKAPMIATMKATHGIFVKIENYCFYQDSKNYESNNEGNDESNDESNNESSTNTYNINKNDNNDNNNILPYGSMSEQSPDPMPEPITDPFKEVIDFYNKHRNMMPKATTLTNKRKGLINARLKKYGIDTVKQVILKAEASDFLNGGGNKGWIASGIDWIMGPENFAKILEGKYDNDRYKHPVEKSRYRDMSDYNPFEGD